MTNTIYQIQLDKDILSMLNIILRIHNIIVANSNLLAIASRCHSLSNMCDNKLYHQLLIEYTMRYFIWTVCIMHN